MIAANYFDGRSAVLHPVQLETGGSMLTVAGAAIARAYTRAEVTLAEPFARAPAVLYFADGARCEVSDRADRIALAQALGYRSSAVIRLQQRWYAALAAVALLLGAAIAAVTWGVPALADRIARSIPPTFDQRIGNSLLAGMEKTLLAPSQLPPAVIADVEQILREIAPPRPQPLRVRVRRSTKGQANAYALPNGVIVVNDDLLNIVLANKEASIAYRRAQVAGVLAHEIGHLEQRHSVRTVARSSLTAAVSATLFGDFSGVAAGVPAVLLNMHYSRAMESQADAYATALLAQHGIAAAPMADLYDTLEAAYQADPGHVLPGWLTDSMVYMESHPASAERSARIRAARQH